MQKKRKFIISRMKKAAGLCTQKELADNIGISPSQVSDFISNDHGTFYKRIVKFAERFNVSTDWLLTGKESSGVDLQETSLLLEEIRLLEKYRVLPEEQKKYIDNLIRVFVDKDIEVAKAIMQNIDMCLRIPVENEHHTDLQKKIMTEK
tara:strand:+ start:436 stop:882 length:447 start_codon:yes stop_codon:yes gene_type:complete